MKPPGRVVGASRDRAAGRRQTFDASRQRPEEESGPGRFRRTGARDFKERVLVGSRSAFFFLFFCCPTLVICTAWVMVVIMIVVLKVIMTVVLKVTMRREA